MVVVCSSSLCSTLRQVSTSVITKMKIVILDLEHLRELGASSSTSPCPRECRERLAGLPSLVQKGPHGPDAGGACKIRCSSWWPARARCESASARSWRLQTRKKGQNKRKKKEKTLRESDRPGMIFLLAFTNHWIARRSGIHPHLGDDANQVVPGHPSCLVQGKAKLPRRQHGLVEGKQLFPLCALMHNRQRRVALLSKECSHIMCIKKKQTGQCFKHSINIHD